LEQFPLERLVAMPLLPTLEAALLPSLISSFLVATLERRDRLALLGLLALLGPLAFLDLLARLGRLEPLALQQPLTLALSPQERPDRLPLLQTLGTAALLFLLSTFLGETLAKQGQVELLDRLDFLDLLAPLDLLGRLDHLEPLDSLGRLDFLDRLDCLAWWRLLFQLFIVQALKQLASLLPLLVVTARCQPLTRLSLMAWLVALQPTAQTQRC
jgi:hypothetical protein